MNYLSGMAQTNVCSAFGVIAISLCVSFDIRFAIVGFSMVFFPQRAALDSIRYIRYTLGQSRPVSRQCGKMERITETETNFIIFLFFIKAFEFTLANIRNTYTLY